MFPRKITLGQTVLEGKDVEKLRDHLITLRYMALAAKKPDWALCLSHTIAVLNWAIDQLTSIVPSDSRVDELNAEVKRLNCELKTMRTEAVYWRARYYNEDDDTWKDAVQSARKAFGFTEHQLNMTRLKQEER